MDLTKDLTKIIQQLKNNEYGGWVSIEYGGYEEPKQAVPVALRRIQEII